MDDDIFEVGLPVSIEINYKYYMTTSFIGWERGAFLATGIASSTHIGGPLKINDHCKLRFLRDGIAYGFETKIIWISLYPFPIAFLEYPKAIEHYTLRKFNRIKSNFRAHFSDEHGTSISDATVTNISAGGCGLNIPAQECEDLTFKKNYKIAFSILEMDMRLDCVIRKMRFVKDTCCLGIEFTDISSSEKDKINFVLEAYTDVLTSRIDGILSKLKTADESLGGRFDDLLLSDILQIFDQIKQEGILNITFGERKGFITLCKGLIMDASLENMHAEDALAEFLSLKKGGFQFFAKEITSGHIQKPINFILMDLSSLIDEREAMAEYCPSPRDMLIFVKDPDTEDHVTKTIVDAFQGGASSIAEVQAVTGLSLIRSTLAAARLVKDGCLMEAT